MGKYIAIMAGGVGSRFWPASREDLPKQFLDILGVGKSLLRLTYERSLKIVPNENILIVTNKRYKALCMEHLPELPEQNILCEPSRNNTAPCVAYTSLHINARDEHGVMAVLPSDHIILKEDEFARRINQAMDYATDHDALVTLGINPTRPDTGYGYIEMGNEVKHNGGSLNKVESFREKPDMITAESYLETGRYVWNAGIFVWSIPSILKAYENNAPSILEVLATDISKYGTAAEQSYIDEYYPKTEKISVDYAIMEKSKNVYTIPVEIGWSDLGTWASLHAIKEKNDLNTVLLGKGITLNTSNTLISASKDKLVVAEGLDDFIVIDQSDVLLIWPKSREQEIKALRQEIEKMYGGKFL